MIISALFQLIALVISTLLGLIPGWDWPSWLTASGPGTLVGSAETFGQNFAGFQGWIDFAALVQAVALVLVLSGAAFAVKVVRSLVSLLTGGGGSAA